MHLEENPNFLVRPVRSWMVGSSVSPENWKSQKLEGCCQSMEGRNRVQVKKSTYRRLRGKLELLLSLDW